MPSFHSSIRWITEHPLAALWLLVGFTSTIGGLMGIVEGWVRWHDFFAHHFLDYYKSFVRQPIAWVVGLVWPTSWPKLPGWAFDIAVIWAVAASAAVRFYNSAAAPHDENMRLNQALVAVFWPAYFLRQLRFYWRNLDEKIRIGGADQKLSDYEEWVMYKELARQKSGFRRALNFITVVAATVVVLLAGNYQLDLIEAEKTQQSAKSGLAWPIAGRPEARPAPDRDRQKKPAR